MILRSLAPALSTEVTSDRVIFRPVKLPRQEEIGVHEMTADQEQDSGRDFTRKLNQLYDEQRDPGGKCYTNAEIAARVNKSGTAAITEAYLSLLRNGKRPEPRLSVADAIARAFGVSPSYFLPDEPDPPPTSMNDAETQLRELVRDNPALASQVDLLLTMSRAGVGRIGARGTQFTDEGRRAFTRVILAAGRLSEPKLHAVLNVAEVMADETASEPSDER